jgi:hypothetical protein
MAGKDQQCVCGCASICGLSSSDLIASAGSGDLIRFHEKRAPRLQLLPRLIETFLSGAGLTREYFSLSQTELPAEHIAAREEAGEPYAVRSLVMYTGSREV